MKKKFKNGTKNKAKLRAISDLVHQWETQLPAHFYLVVKKILDD